LKIAVTADLHLTSIKKHADRFHALGNILDQLVQEKIEHLIIAGDLFDKDIKNTADFESIIKNKKYQHIKVHIVPGNHDPRLTHRDFTSGQIAVYSKAEIKSFDLISLPVFFLPYIQGKTMGEVIATHKDEFAKGKWILVGHGDWFEGLRVTNPYEPGVYMPLTRADIEIFQPACAILGHIHKPTDSGLVYYPGSPSPLDINENGKRRFLILDSENGSVTEKEAISDFLYFNESLVVLPMEDEKTFITKWVESTIKKWSLSEHDKSRVRLRLNVSGYTTDKHKLFELLKLSFQEYRFYKNEEPDLTQVSRSEDVEKIEIVKRISTAIDKFDWPYTDEQPDKEQILLEALRVIYGE